MKNSTSSSKDIIPDEIKNHLNDTLIEHFYLFGIDPNCLNLSEFNSDKKYLSKDFKQPQLLTKFPPSDRFQSDIDPTALMSHCFPNGFFLIESEKNPKDEFFYFHLNNLLSLSDSDKTFYFVCAMIYEPIKPYFNVKFQHKLPDFDDKKGEKSVDFNKIYVPKILCFSSFVCFPHEIKILMTELLKYTRSNNVTLPIEIIFENIVFGMPRPLKAYFYVSCNKSNGLIPNQSKDIDFNLREINQYNFSSFPFQSIFSVFSTTNILGIYRCIILEFPVLFFSADKEKLTSVVETFLSLLYPFEYQYPHVAILPDCNAGIIEMEKSYVFGINKKFERVTQDGTNIISYFSEMHLNLSNRVFLLCDIDESKVNAYCGEKDMYHVVNFEDLGIYQETNLVDPTLSVSKDVYTGKLTDITQDTQLPDRYTDKLKNKLEAYKKEIKNFTFDYSLNNNKRIGEEFFYYYLASVFMTYNNYLYNGKEDIERIWGELMVKKPDEINIENLFMVNQFIQDYRNDNVFFQKFFKTKIFKNFIIRKYLNKPLDKYIFLNFDEKILEKKNKRIFARKIKTEFVTSKNFQSTHPYQMRPPVKKFFSEEELTYMKNNKSILLNQYYQSLGDDNKIKYLIFPKFIYDNKFFKKKYNNCTDFSQNKPLINLLKKYQEIEDILTTEKSKNFFSIYNGEFINRYNLDYNKCEYHNEVYNTLYQVWLIVFCLTFHYCDEMEKLYRFEELIRIIPKLIDPEEKILSFIFLTIREYGNEEMVIKLFELLKNLNYAEYSCLCGKFKSNKRLNWDVKEIDIANSKVVISYYREPINYDKQTTDNFGINKKKYDIKLLRKRTFFTGKEKVICQYDKEKISIDLYYTCQCKHQSLITDFTVNLPSQKKEKLLICPGCKKKLEPVYHAAFGQEKIEFKIYSIIEMFKIAKGFLKKYGTKIDIDELREKYKDFFWSCIMYFKFNSLSFEILLKYRDTIPELQRSFKILKISKQ